MDPNQLNKFFPFDNSLDDDTEDAINQLLKGAKEFADTLQRLLPESQKKFDLHMMLLSITREAEFRLYFLPSSRP